MPHQSEIVGKPIENGRPYRLRVSLGTKTVTQRALQLTMTGYNWLSFDSYPQPVAGRRILHSLGVQVAPWQLAMSELCKCYANEKSMRVIACVSVDI